MTKPNMGGETHEPSPAPAAGPPSPGLLGGVMEGLVMAIPAFIGGFVATLLFSETDYSFLPGVVGGLALLGVYWLFSLVWRSAKDVPPPRDLLGPAALSISSDAMALVEDGQKIIESNAAYRELSRSEGPAQPSPERFLALMPGTQSAMSELLASIAAGKKMTRAIRFDSGIGGRQLQITVQPLGSARRVLWALRMIDSMGQPIAPFAPAPAVSVAPAVPQSAVDEPVRASGDGDGHKSGSLAQEPTLSPVVAPAVAPVSTVVADPGDVNPLLETWERAPAGVARFSPARVLVANAGLCRILGYGLAEWGSDGLPLRDVVTDSHLAALRKALTPGNKPANLDLTLIRKDGSEVPVYMRLGLVDREGLATAILLPRAVMPGPAPVVVPAAPPVPVPAPVPVLTPAVSSVTVGEDRFFMSAPLALAMVDGKGRIRAANAAFARLFGPVARTGERLSAAMAETDAVALETLLGDARARARDSAETPPSLEVALAQSGRSARLYAAPLGVPGEVALCAIETSEQKALEAQFAQSQRLQAVGHLAGGVAHDFNNVLTAIIGYCDLLLARHRPSDPSFPDIMQIKQNANRAAALVRQLLAFSRRQTLRPQVIELTDVISDVSELLRRLIGERITLEVHHARDLWPVKVDVNQFEQVIVNLVVNARDAMPDGGTLTLRTSNVPDNACASYGKGLVQGDYVLVEVEDTGTGIPADVIDKIFEPFFSTKEVGKGTGLGLSTVYGIVQQTGGTILAASEPGKGSTFRVFLPRHVPEAVEEAPRAPEPEVKVGDSTGQGCILLVEDEDAVRAFASRALSGRGYEVLTAASGVEAMQVMERLDRKLDLVISDVVMPEMDGPSLLRELRAREPGLKVIFISGYAEEAFAKNLPPGEHFSFLPKPFSLKDLVAAVNEALKGEK